MEVPFAYNLWCLGLETLAVAVVKTLQAITYHMEHHTLVVAFLAWAAEATSAAITIALVFAASNSFVIA